MPIVRRSLQRPSPGEPYLTEDLKVIPAIKQALANANQGDCDRRRAMAAEIGPRWGIEDDDDRVKLAFFGCKILQLVRPYLHKPQISSGFLEDEIQSFQTLRWALNRGQLWRRQKMFLEAPDVTDLHKAWLQDIREQSMEVLLALKKMSNP